MSLLSDLVAANSALQADNKAALSTKHFGQAVTAWAQSFAPSPPVSYSGLPLLIRSY